MAEEVIRTPFGVINADDFYGAQSFQTLAAHMDSGDSSYSMVGFVLRNTLSEFGTVARGVCKVTDGYMANVQEVVGIERVGQGARYNDAQGMPHTLTGDEIVSMNMWGFDPTLFEPLRQHWIEFLQARGSDEKAEFFIPTLVNTLIESGRKRVKILPTQSSWFGVTYREDRPFVAEGIRRLIQNGEYPERL